MNKKNLPNIPIYIGDWERDCNVLSLESEAAWMRIVFKLWTKGKQNSIKIPTKSIQNLWRCGPEKMREILDDMIYNEIAEIKEEQGFVEFTCRRFVRENNLSKIRSNASKGNKTKSNNKQKSSKTQTNHKQNTDNEIENESVIENEVKNESIVWPDFEDFWELYDKKRGSKTKIKKKWDKLPQETKEYIMAYIPLYKNSQSDKQYRKDPQTFLNNESWNDEIILKNENRNNTQGGASDSLKEKTVRTLTGL